MTALREHLDQQGAYLCHSCPSDAGCTRCMHEEWDTLADHMQAANDEPKPIPRCTWAYLCVGAVIFAAWIVAGVFR